MQYEPISKKWVGSILNSSSVCRLSLANCHANNYPKSGYCEILFSILWSHSVYLYTIFIIAKKTFSPKDGACFSVASCDLLGVLCMLAKGLRIFIVGRPSSFVLRPWTMSLFAQAICLSPCRGKGRRGGIMVSALVSGSRGPGSSPGRGHCVVFLGKTLYSYSASLHPGI